MSLKRKLLNWAKNKNKVTINWTDIQNISGEEDYNSLFSKINQMVEDGVLKAVGKKTNGRKPSLNEKYRILVEEEDLSEYIYEIDYLLHPIFKKSYYRKNVKSYIKNRENILMLNKYISEKQYLLETKITLNERSFEIFKKEKFMKDSVFETMIKNLGLEKEFFNCSKAIEPIPYNSVSKKVPQNVLFVENKDTYCSIRRYMEEVSTNVLGVDINTIVYTSGKRKIPSVEDLEYCTDKYVANPNNTFYYFGDIDYEGINMFDYYNSKIQGDIEIKPLVSAYEYMLDKMIDDIDSLPETKDGQKESIKNIFFKEFDEVYVSKFLKVLLRRKYIPQEALNYGDLINYNKRRK